MGCLHHWICLGKGFVNVSNVDLRVPAYIYIRSLSGFCIHTHTVSVMYTHITCTPPPQRMTYTLVVNYNMVAQCHDLMDSVLAHIHTYVHTYVDMHTLIRNTQFNSVMSCYNILCKYVRMYIHTYVYTYIGSRLPRCNNIIMTGAQYTEYGQLRVNYVCIFINAPLSMYLPSIRKPTPYVRLHALTCAVL